MIFCLFHQPALRRHLDDGEPLSARAQSHLGHCRHCREMLRSHLAIIHHLSAKAGEPVDPPPFLHARVMNGLRERSSENQPSFALRWTMGIAVIVMAATLLAFWPLRHSSQQAASWPDVHSDITFKTTLPANPLEIEIENLR